MSLRSKMLFILIGDDKTGKTTVQKILIERLCGIIYKSLPVNTKLAISQPDIKRKYDQASFGNRSFQEKIGDYKTVENYFEQFFKDADIAFTSSHLSSEDIEEMIRQGKRRYFNVYGVFFKNSIKQSPGLNANIAELNWNERLIVKNPFKKTQPDIDYILKTIADDITTFIIQRTGVS